GDLSFRLGAAMSQALLANLALDEHDLPAAAAAAGRAQEILRAGGRAPRTEDAFKTAWIDVVAGDVARAQGRSDEARRAYGAAIGRVAALPRAWAAPTIGLAHARLALVSAGAERERQVREARALLEPLEAAGRLARDQRAALASLH